MSGRDTFTRDPADLPARNPVHHLQPLERLEAETSGVQASRTGSTADSGSSRSIQPYQCPRSSASSPIDSVSWRSSFQQTWTTPRRRFVVPSLGTIQHFQPIWSHQSLIPDLPAASGQRSVRPSTSSRFQQTCPSRRVPTSSNKTCPRSTSQINPFPRPSFPNLIEQPGHSSRPEYTRREASTDRQSRSSGTSSVRCLLSCRVPVDHSRTYSPSETPSTKTRSILQGQLWQSQTDIPILGRFRHHQWIPCPFAPNKESSRPSRPVRGKGREIRLVRITWSSV